MLTAAQAAARLGISRTRVYRLIARGRLGAINMSAGDKQPRWAIRSDVFERFINPEQVTPRDLAMINQSVPRQMDAETRSRISRLMAGRPYAIAEAAHS